MAFNNEESEIKSMRSFLFFIFAILCSIHMLAVNIRLESISGVKSSQDIAKIGKLVFVDDEIRLMDKSGNVLAVETIGNVRKITFVEDVATDLDSLLPTQILLYPNPSHDIIHVDGIEPTNLRVFDLQGRMLLTNYGNQILVAELPMGTYLLQVGTQVVRFIKR